MLNLTGVRIELLTDHKMVDLFEDGETFYQHIFSLFFQIIILLLFSGIRGGVSFVPHKYIDAEEENVDIKYLDANNLYG